MATITVASEGLELQEELPALAVRRSVDQVSMDVTDGQGWWSDLLIPVIIARLSTTHQDPLGDNDERDDCNAL